MTKMPTERLWIDQHIENIKRLYVDEKLSATKIGKMYKVSHTAILDCMERHGVARRTKSQCGQEMRIYTQNEDYFERIDTPGKSYMLGFLYADGYNFTPKNVVTLKIQERDRKVLDLLARDVGTDFKIITKEPEGCGVQNLCTLRFQGKKISQDLEKLGLVRAKSLILKFPTSDQVPDYLLHHFVRGYFDGDGCICLPKGDPTFARISMCVSLDFCLELQKVLAKIGARTSYVKTSKIHRLDCCGRQQCMKVFRWMFQDAGEYFLDRKRDSLLKLGQYDTKKSGTSSRYIGVYFLKSRGKYVSSIEHDKKKRRLGCFKTEEEAAAKYNDYVILHGLSRDLNKIAPSGIATQPTEFLDDIRQDAIPLDVGLIK